VLPVYRRIGQQRLKRLKIHGLRRLQETLEPNPQPLRNPHVRHHIEAGWRKGTDPMSHRLILYEGVSVDAEPTAEGAFAEFVLRRINANRIPADGRAGRGHRRPAIAGTGLVNAVWTGSHLPAWGLMRPSKEADAQDAKVGLSFGP
jgi:hypothetical protein